MPTLYDTPDGQTHHENDGCGEPAHNPMPKTNEEWEKNKKIKLNAIKENLDFMNSSKKFLNVPTDRFVWEISLEELLKKECYAVTCIPSSPDKHKVLKDFICTLRLQALEQGRKEWKEEVRREIVDWTPSKLRQLEGQGVMGITIDDHKRNLSREILSFPSLTTDNE